MSTKQISAEALLELHRRLTTLPPRSHERRLLMQDAAHLYGVSEPTLYRALAVRGRPKIARRADRGTPRVSPQDQLERYCELIAAIKVRTSNKKQRHLSTGEAIRLLEEFGLETPDGFVQAPKSRLIRTTVNRYLAKWGFDRARLLRQPAAVRFQAEHSNACWQFDLSPSDLKAVKAPSWVRPEVGAPTLMLFSVVDDRSGVAYQEYHCVYGEDVEVVAVLSIVAFVSLPVGTAGEGKSIVQMVRAAKTSADERAIAAVFEKEAKTAQQKAKEHSQLKDVYAAKSDMQTMVSHCEMLVKHYQEIATELTAMAEMHKKMGAMGGMAR